MTQLPTGAIGGIVGGSVVLVVVLLAVTISACLMMRRRKKMSLQISNHGKNFYHTDSQQSYDSRRLVSTLWLCHMLASILLEDRCSSSCIFTFSLSPSLPPSHSSGTLTAPLLAS